MQSLTPSKLVSELGLLFLKRITCVACCLAAIRVLA